MTLLDRVCASLDARHVEHALIGAGALAAAGVARSTFDIDLLTTDSSVLDAGLWDDVRASGATVEIRRGDDDDPLGGVVRIEQGAERPVDVILGRHGWQSRAVARATRLSGGPPVVQARDLVLLKLYAGGTQDVWDIRALLEGPGRARLVADVDADLAALPARMRELWSSLLS